MAPAGTIACPCGVVFERWITPWNVELDLLRADGPSYCPNVTSSRTNGKPKSRSYSRTGIGVPSSAR